MSIRPMAAARRPNRGGDGLRRRWSESPIARAATKRTPAMGSLANLNGIMATTWGPDKPGAANAWVIEWQGNVPPAFAGAVRLGALVQTVGDTPARTTLEVTLVGGGPDQIVTFTGGPWGAGEIVTSEDFTIDMSGGTSLTVYVLYVAGWNGHPSATANGWELSQMHIGADV